MTLPTKTVVALASAGMFFALSGPATAQQTKKPSTAGANFAENAAEAGVLEVDLGKLAVQKGASDQVKQFGMRMVDDHSKAGDELNEIAAKDNLAVPFQVNAGDQSIVDRLSKLTGDAFDRAYLRQMVTDHEKAVALFQREASNGTNPDLKTWAMTTLPMLQDHLRQARETETRLGGPTL